MATLTLVVGPVTATKTANNTTVAAVIDDYVAAYFNERSGESPPISAQDKAEWFMADLVRHIIEVANGQNVRTVVKAADDNARESIKQRKWN